MLSVTCVLFAVLLRTSQAIPLPLPKEKLFELAKQEIMLPLNGDADSDDYDDKDSGVNKNSCQSTYCSHEATACFTDVPCASEMLCSGLCSLYWPLDHDPAKLKAQNCTLKCGQSFPTDDATANYLTCMFDNNCINTKPTNISCPVELFTENVQKNASIASWSGDWWIHYGHNPVYDCSYPCQAIHNMHQINADAWNYTFSYLESTITNKQKFYEQSIIFPNPPAGQPIDFSYTYFGTQHNETWYPLEATDRYIVHVDCSYYENWIVIGGMLWVRPDVTLSNDELASVSAAFGRVGWNFPNDFCSVHYQGNCPY